MCKRTAKNVNFCPVAAIRDETRNAFPHLPLEEGCWGRQNVQAPAATKEKSEQELETGTSRSWDEEGSGQGGRKAESWDSDGWHNSTKTSC